MTYRYEMVATAEERAAADTALKTFRKLLNGSDETTLEEDIRRAIVALVAMGEEYADVLPADLLDSARREVETRFHDAIIAADRAENPRRRRRAVEA